MAKIKHDHAVTQMALSNLDAWVNSPRVLSMIVCMVVYCVMQGVVDQGGFWVAGIELQLTLPEKLFVKLYNSFYSMGSLLFLVMVRLKQNEWINENTEEAVINAYLDQLASTVNDLPQIPEKYFAKYKHKHVRKKEFSQFIDRHKASPWLWCKILFLLKGLGLYEKENKNIAKRSPKGDLASADMK